MSSRILLQPGLLWQNVVRTTEHAIQSGALKSLPTGHEFVKDAGICFSVRILESIERKREEKKRQEKQAESGKKVNPFLPFERDLFVAGITDSHIALLNKFNVADHHLLIVTREFEDQRLLLCERDFIALWACMREFEGIGFYNGGEEAGASQPHRHFQIIPLPLAPEGPKVPIEPLLAGSVSGQVPGSLPGFPFLHSFIRLEPDLWRDPAGAAAKTFSYYSDLLRRAGLNLPDENRPVLQSAPYCLLVTREWMLLVPRSRECFDSISINSLGFAGALLVRNRNQLDVLKKAGPMNALSAVAMPAPLHGK